MSTTTLKWEKSWTQLAFEGQLAREQVAAWITEAYGERHDFDDDCPCCKKWATFDLLFQGLDEE